MKLASYRSNSQDEFGIVAGDGIISLNSRLGGKFATLRQMLGGCATAELEQIASSTAPDREISRVQFLPVIPNPDKIICIGYNYRAHIDEAGKEAPEHPSIFMRLTNTLVGHDGAMVRPSASRNFDFEGELAVIIGRRGRHIPAEQALDFVAGYTCFVDGSVRDYQKHSVSAGKNFIATGPLGPWMTTAGEIPDPSRLVLRTRLNGVEMQRSGADMLVYSIPSLIAYLSDMTVLEPGDIIATGTPAGVGHRRNPQVWMKAGDVLEVEISGIGVLRSHVADE